MSKYAEPMRAEWADAVARNVADAPPFSAATLEKLATILGPAGERARRNAPKLKREARNAR